MNQTKIGIFLKQLRNEKGLTQGQLAEMLDVSNRSVSRWETGSTLPDISILIELAEFYEVDFKEIIDGERKNRDTNVESKELMNKVLDYTSKDKEEILAKTKQYSGIAVITLFACGILDIYDYADKYLQITYMLFWITLTLIMSIWLLCSGKATEMRKNKKKRTKYFVLLFAVLILATFLVTALLTIL